LLFRPLSAESALQEDLSDWFEIKSGVRQTPSHHQYFSLPWIGFLSEQYTEVLVGTTVGEETFTDLDYADLMTWH